MSVTITIDRTDDGTFRAELTADPKVVIEGADLAGLVEELKDRLDAISVAADGEVFFFNTKAARPALRNEELDALIERYPVPPDWGNEPGWADAL